MKKGSVLFLSVLSAVIFGQGTSAKAMEMWCVPKDGLIGEGFAAVNGQRLPATARLHFDHQVNDGLRELRNFRGDISIQLSKDDAEDRVTGKFSKRLLNENENYRPTKYRGYSQFKGLTASVTRDSSTSDLAGDFVMSKVKKNGTAQAHFIFQSGDHHGGTMSFDCYKTVYYSPM